MCTFDSKTSTRTKLAKMLPRFWKLFMLILTAKLSINPRWKRFARTPLLSNLSGEQRAHPASRRLRVGCSPNCPFQTNLFLGKEFENDQNAKEFGMPMSLFPIFLALNATSHVPSATSSEILATIESDLPGTSTNLSVIAASEEVARAKGGELHNISALTGGMIAQEVIKIITKQYIPIDNTCVFDGIASRAQIFRL